MNSDKKDYGYLSIPTFNSQGYNNGISFISWIWDHFRSHWKFK